MRLLFAFLFSTLLLTSSIAPTLSYFAVLDCDITVFMDVDEEEQEGKETKESNAEKEVKVCHEYNYSSCSNDELNAQKGSFYSNLYASSYREVASPPPKSV